MNKITINNENIAKYVMFKLDKIDNNFTSDELNQITELVINYEEDNFINLEELLKLPSIKSLTIRNGYIYNNDYNVLLKLNNLEEIVFENCEFENADIIALINLKKLSLINCKINNYTFINIFENLEELTIINGSINIKRLNLLRKLHYLQLSYSKILDKEELNIEELIELYIDNTNIKDFNFTENLPNLKILSIDENQFNNNKELVKKLTRDNVLVLNENMVEFEGDNLE